MTYKIQIDDEVRNATADEITEIEANQAEVKVREADAKAKAQAKTAALAKLAALGLTVEDLQALGL
jgi:hypothetical protein